MSLKAENSINSELNPEKERIMNEGIAEFTEEEVKDAEFKPPEGISVGVETEFYVLDGDDEPISEEQRDQLIGKEGDRDELDKVDHELGASMVEIASEPIHNLQNLDDLKDELKETEENLRQRVEEEDLQLIRHGTNTAQDIDEIERTTTEDKYIAVPNAYGQMRIEDEFLEFSEDINAERMTDEFGEIDAIDPRNEYLPASICSTQLNMQAEDLDDAVEKANIGYAIAPYITALSGNSRLVDGKDLGFNDTRMELWEKGFEIGDFDKDDIDIGKIDEYFEDFEDVIERITEQPRIVNDEEIDGISDEYAEKAEDMPLNVAEGMFWKDSRIKTADKDEVNDEVLVEFRQNSTQPTPEEDIAVHAFYIGRIIYEQEIVDRDYPSDLLDEELVNKNRYTAMREGLDTELYDWEGEKRDAKEVIEEELKKAREGLEHAGIHDEGYMNLLENRLEKETVPSDEVAQAYYENLPERDYDEISEKQKRRAAVQATKEVNMRNPKNVVKAA
jgi:gamma-glutamyl:cysteine ligase YbdK (ATP-grasp superfamily)